MFFYIIFKKRLSFILETLGNYLKGSTVCPAAMNKKIELITHFDLIIFTTNNKDSYTYIYMYYVSAYYNYIHAYNHARSLKVICHKCFYKVTIFNIRDYVSLV